MSKLCIACAEEIKTEAKLCKHCGTRQDESSFLEESGIPNSVGKQQIKNRPGNSCPRCNQIDAVSRVSTIVDTGSNSSSAIGFATQLGSGHSPYANVSMGSSTTHLADRLTIHIPYAVFSYKFIDFAFGVFITFGLFIGLVFKEGSPVDAGPFNPIFAGVLALVTGPIFGIYTATARKKNQQRGIYELQQNLLAANEELRSAYYCVRDDLVFNQDHSASPEDFIDYLIELEEADDAP
jgi:hypothetical protein